MIDFNVVCQNLNDWLGADDENEIPDIEYTNNGNIEYVMWGCITLYCSEDPECDFHEDFENGDDSRYGWELTNNEFIAKCKIALCQQLRLLKSFKITRID